jgi:hypothetical protein
MASTEKTDQIVRFRSTARALGCDDDKEKFEAALRKIAAHKPKKENVCDAGNKNPDRKTRRSNGKDTD